MILSPERDTRGNASQLHEDATLDSKQHDRDDQRAPTAEAEEDERDAADVRPVTEALENLEEGLNQVGEPRDEQEDED